MVSHSGPQPKIPPDDESAPIFRDIWNRLESEIGKDKLRFPREIIWLGGAPGSGKGTNTPFILRERGITAAPIVTSDLLNSPEMQRIKDAGNLVGDREVVGLLFRKLLTPTYENGVLVDGFPRTRIQVECLKLLYQRMLELRHEFRSTPLAPFFPKPAFHITILYVEEKESVDRQIKRGRTTLAHNQRVAETGVGAVHEERPTDFSEESARKRYRVFMDQTYGVLQSLKQVFHFHIINAQADIAAVERNIMREFKYQSSLELEDETLDAINHIPIAGEIVLNARQHLVRRLDSYQRDQEALFKRVIAVIDQEIMPVVLIHGITGLAKITTENEIFANQLAMNMLIDVMNERGYRVTGTVEARDIPARIDPATNY
ncbi:MAG: nucleoside monophosphate kinase, partial [Planctomycetes bacterium]|nr:nucleoside monophosphate kinase [Planctomycetota bacterium]